MNVIPSSAAFLDANGKSAYELMELIGRTCYKSTDKITPDSAVKFCQGLKKSGHHAMLEHAHILLKVKSEEVIALVKALLDNDESIDGENNIPFNLNKYLNISYIGQRPSAYCIVSGSFRSFIMIETYANKAYQKYIDEQNRYGTMDTGLDHILKLLKVISDKYSELFEESRTLIEKLGISLSTNDYKVITRDELKAIVADLNDVDRDALLRKHITHTVMFTCDRGVSHEYVRHRPCSFGQESTRYCNYSKDKFGNAITVIDPLFWEKGSEQYAIWKDACEYVEKAYFKLIGLGATPQEARSVLPNSLKTEIAITATEDEWQHIINLRYHGTTGKPHPQMVESMTCVYDTLCKASDGRLK